MISAGPRHAYYSNRPPSQSASGTLALLLDKLARTLFGGRFSQPDFTFIDPGPLVENELQLIAPDALLLEDVLFSANHPLIVVAGEGAMSREHLLEFLKRAPGGREPRDRSRNLSPAYHFWMKPRALPGYTPPLPIAGGLSLRIGDNADLNLYLGHIGYHVHAPARGRHFASRAVRLVLPIAKRHGMTELWITCNPDNVASRKSIEHAGGIFVETVPVPENHPLTFCGETEKCRYRFRL